MPECEEHLTTFGGRPSTLELEVFTKHYPYWGRKEANCTLSPVASFA
jgi:hypothetical protein